MHTETGTRIDLADSATGFSIRLRDIPGQEVDTANIESDRFDGTFSHLTIVRVNDVGYVNRGTTGGEVGR